MPFTPLPIQKASISVAASGDNTASIAAPGSGLRNRILSYRLANRSDTTTDVILKDGTTAINGDGERLIKQDTDQAGGVMSYDAPDTNGGIPLGDNAAFVVNLSNAKQHSGFVVYVTEPVE